jgi:hypothetical protein
LSCLSLQHLNYIIGILAVVLLVFTASDYIIGIIKRFLKNTQ